jgi:hypothetical protein
MLSFELFSPLMVRRKENDRKWESAREFIGKRKWKEGEAKS